MASQLKDILAPALAQSARAIAPVIEVVSQYKDLVPADNLKLGLLGIFGLTGVMKILSPGALENTFKFYPGFFWMIAGLWEMVICYFMYIGDYTIAAPMAYVFLGGAIYSLLKTPMFIAAPMPMMTSFATYTLAKGAGTDTSEWIILCWVFGAVAGIMFTGEPPSKKKRQ